MAEPRKKNESDEQPQADAQASGDLGAAEVQRNMDAEQEQGFRGTKVDPTPNEAYTLQGVVSGQPTPETDASAAQEARNATGLGLSGVESQERANARFEQAARDRR